MLTVPFWMKKARPVLSASSVLPAPSMATLDVIIGSDCVSVTLPVRVMVLEGSPLVLAAKIAPRRSASVARSEEHTSELQSLMRSSYAVFCLKKKKNNRRERHQT